MGLENKIHISNGYIAQGNCLELMADIADGSADMILCDLPYGTTKNKWDSVIPLDRLWLQYERIIKDDGCIALFAQTPFDKVLGASNLKLLKYEWIWKKDNVTGFLNAKKMPLKLHENILIFYNFFVYICLFHIITFFICFCEVLIAYFDLYFKIF